MVFPKHNRPERRRCQSGFTLVEVFVAGFLLLVVMFGLAQVYAKGRTQIDFEEDRRKATAVAQDRMDAIRRDFVYDDLGTLDGAVVGYPIDGNTFTVTHAVTVGAPEGQSTTIDLTVTWNALVNGAPVARSLVSTTILGRGMP